MSKSWHVTPIDGVGYGLSSNGFQIVTLDPYAFSPSRNFINITISLGMVWCLAILVSIYPSVRKCPNKVGLIWAVALSLIASGVHHVDNFLRVPLYFLPSWIYNGFLFILDVGLINWVVAAYFAMKGTLIVLSDEASSDQKKCTWGFRYLYLHCIMIWSGQMHYRFEPITSFVLSANISILCEGAFAVILHIYCLLVQSKWRESISGPIYSRIPAEEVELTSSQANDDISGRTTVRRRSKEALLYQMN